MTNRTYLMSLECICSGLEVVVKNPNLSEKERTEQIKIAIDKVLAKYNN
ncbi:hypothetical protein H6G64_35350 [Calothrix sp. FACHB-156]|nr:hypothetical protein [Calothrix sp. FACHB-156]